MIAVLHDPPPPPPDWVRPVLAIGNFDGMHRGHRAVIEAALAMAAGRPAGLLTFEPHPRSFFRPQEPMFRLTPEPVKVAIAERLGLDLVVELTFDQALSSLDAEEFCDQLLVRRLQVAGIAVGHDFHFGKGRSGSPAFLQEAGRRAGFAVHVVPPLASGGVPVSATQIRGLLEAGDVAGANVLLGYEWLVRAEVMHGDKRGRDLGYPTANLRLDPGCRLALGIYAVRAVIDGKTHAAVASFGRRPTFDNGAVLLEVHVFDFRGDLYGKTIDIAFVERLRGEEKFASVEALVAQMDRDSAAARAILAKPITGL